MNPPKAIVLILQLLLIIGISTADASTVNDPFPIPDIIKPNVEFWTKIYTQYTSDQAIVHDNQDLNIVYDVINLVPYDRPGAAKINRNRMKKAKKKYEHRLWRLSKNPETNSRACLAVAKLFPEPHSSSLFSKAALRVRCQIGQRDRFRTGLIRSGAYIDEIRSILVSNNVPSDLAYLPHVESSFNTKAYSKFGAAGIWQFTRSTGKRFMSVGYTLDERRDPILATYAAAALLRENYEKLGCWALAITAYNHGAAGMQKAKDRHSDYEKIFTFYNSRTFKFASRNFYSEFIAARHVASHYKDYFGELRLDTPIETETVVLKGYAAFDDLSRHFQVEAQTLREMNPALRDPVFSGQKYVPQGYPLRLPALSSDAQQLLSTAIPDTVYQKKQKPSHFYTVQRGDTAGKIARIHQVKLSDLILSNNLNHRATIYPRQTLRIPIPDEPIEKPAIQPAATPAPIVVAEADRVQNSESEPQPEQEINRQSAAPEDSLSILQPPGNELETDDNDEPPTESYPQPILASVIPLGPPNKMIPTQLSGTTADVLAGNEEIVAVDIEFLNLANQNGQPVGLIQVEVEETLGHYAEWSQVRTQQIRNINRLAFGQVLHLHQKIKIPLHHTDAEAFKQNRYEFHKRLQEDFFAVYHIGELQLYKVRRGDNFWSICREKFEIPMWLLKHCNPDIDLADLRAQQQIQIPVIEKADGDNTVPETNSETIPETDIEPELELELEKSVQANIQLEKL